MNQWIDVNDSLPAIGQPVFAALKDGYVNILSREIYIEYDDDDNRCDSHVWARADYQLFYLRNSGTWGCGGDWDGDYNVTHWMPFPSHPLAKGEGDE